MSKLFFHTPNETVSVIPFEFQWRGFGTNEALRILNPYFNARGGREWARKITDSQHDMFETPAWRSYWEPWFDHHHGDEGLRVGNDVISCADLALNTLIASGTPTRMLLAKLYRGVYHHAWVAAQDAHWFAGLIEAARNERLLEARCGWSDVVRLARDVARGAVSGPIVTDYGTPFRFPHRYIIGEPWFYASPTNSNDQYSLINQDDDAHRRWDALPQAERWRLAVDAVQSRTPSYQISPATIGDRYGCGACAADVAAEAELAGIHPGHESQWKGRQ